MNPGSIILISILVIVVGSVILSLYTSPNPPKVSIEEFSVPAFNKSSDQTAGDIYFDLQLKNMNTAMGVSYDDPFSIAFFYYPYDEPLQKYVFVGTLSAFNQVGGTTNHIRAIISGNNLQLLSTVDLLSPSVPRFNETGNGETNHIRTLLLDHLQLPSMAREMVMNVRIDLVMNVRIRALTGTYTHQTELGGNVLVDFTTGEKVTAGSIELVESTAAAGGPLMLIMLLFTQFLLLIMCF